MMAHGCGRYLPDSAGIGLRFPHVNAVIASQPAIGWLEVHSENYFMAGGRPLQQLQWLRRDYPVSLHGVGLSLGSVDRLDAAHLAKLRQLVEKIEPAEVSEHLSWSSIDGLFANDLLPLPYTREALDCLSEHIDELQTYLGRSILIENISSYLRWDRDDYAEGEFLAALARRTGCRLLLDVNNLYVSSVNHGEDPAVFLDSIPWHAVAEIHLAGHERLPDGCLIDSHSCRVSAQVWQLYAKVLERCGPRPTLIEWDGSLPELAVLLAEAAQAQRCLSACRECAHAGVA